MDEFRLKTNKPKRLHAVDGFIPRSGKLEFNAKAKSGPQDRDLTSTATTQPETISQERQLDSSLHMGAALPTEGLLIDTDSKKHKPKDLRKKKRRTLKVFMSFFAVFFIVGLVYGGYIFTKAWVSAHRIFQGGGNSAILLSKDVKPQQLNGEGDGRVNVLLVGIGGGDHEGADLTDSLMIASIDPLEKGVTLISIPRDLWVYVPDYWSMKINAAYSSAKAQAIQNGDSEKAAEEEGFKTLEQTISDTLGVKIHYHVLVNFQAFKDGVDAVGGITINAEDDLYDPEIGWETNAPNDLIAAKGINTFDGMHALQYARSRYTSSDFARGERQREVIIALKDKVLSTGTFSNPKTVSKLIDALGNNVSMNATMSEVMRMYDIVKDIPSTSIVSASFAEEPNLLITTGMINEQSVVYPIAGADDYSDIQAFMRNTIRDPYLKQENATVAVLNGSKTDGLASTKADELSSYGYNVTTVDAAPTSDYTKTIIYMKPDSTAKFTRNYLEKRFDVSVSTLPTDSPIALTTDFVVVLGADAATNH